MSGPADSVQTLRHRSATGAICLAISSLLLAAFPLVRPFGDRSGNSAVIAGTFGSTPWLVAHILGGLGFVLLPVGLFAMFTFLRGSHVEHRAARGLLVSWIGLGLMLPTVFGTEPFALRAIGQAAVQQRNTDLLAIATAIRAGPQARFFFPGLLLLAIGAIVMGTAVWNSGSLPRWSGVVLAIGLAVFFPLFPRAIRIVDGLLIGIGGVSIAAAILMRSSTACRSARTSGSAAPRTPPAAG